IKYTFDSLKFGTITVVSPVFDEAITYYVAKTTTVEVPNSGAQNGGNVTPAANTPAEESKPALIEVAATTMYYQVFNTLFADGKLFSDDFDGKTSLLSPSSVLKTP